MNYAPRRDENDLKPALEALIKTVERRFCLYIKEKQPIFRPTVFQGVTNMIDHTKNATTHFQNGTVCKFKRGRNQI